MAHQGYGEMVYGIGGYMVNAIATTVQHNVLGVGTYMGI